MSKRCVIIDESEKDDEGNYIPCVIVEGEKGYHTLDWNWGSDFKTAQGFADFHNENLGISKEEVEKLKHGSFVVSTKKVAYFINEMERDENGNYIPCIAKEGETGFWKTDWEWGSDLEVAKNLADEANENLGLDKKDAFAIVLQSMRMD